jgi:hypothetical protein
MSNIDQPETGQTVNILLAINILQDTTTPLDHNALAFLAGSQSAPGRGVDPDMFIARLE